LKKKKKFYEYKKGNLKATFRSLLNDYWKMEKKRLKKKILNLNQ